MDKPDREAQTFFSQPWRQFVTMMLVLGAVSFGGYLAYGSVASVVASNPYLYGVIIFVFVIGVLACFWQVLQLVS